MHEDAGADPPGGSRAPSCQWVIVPFGIADLEQADLSEVDVREGVR